MPLFRSENRDNELTASALLLSHLGSTIFELSMCIRQINVLSKPAKLFEVMHCKPALTNKSFSD